MICMSVLINKTLANRHKKIIALYSVFPLHEPFFVLDGFLHYIFLVLQMVKDVSCDNVTFSVLNVLFSCGPSRTVNCT